MSQAAVAIAEATEFPYFTEEHDLFRQTVKQFVQTEIAPHAEEWDEAGIFPKELFKKAADLGLFGIRLDPKYGGAGLDWWYTAAYLDHPRNPKEARFSERDYGRFGSYFEYDLTPVKPLTIRNRIWFQEGEMTIPQCQAMSDSFLYSGKATAE